MFEHLLIAVDFTPSWDALRTRLPRLRGWGIERLTLVHVLGSRYPQAPAATHGRHYEGELAAAAESLVDAGFSADWELRDGEPARELVAACQAAGADAILLGHRQRERLGGGTVLELARLSRYPLWLEPVAGAAPADPPQTLLLATDGSAASAAAATRFRQLRPRAGRGLAVTALPPAAPADTRRAAEQQLQGLGDAEARLVEGDPRDVIARVGREEAADLIIIGKRGRNLLADVVLGSTADAVCSRAARPVLLVPSV